MSRTVTLVLVDDVGEVLGALPPVRLPTPYWQETADVVECVRERYGVHVDVLRLLHADRPAPPGGRLTLLAQVDGDPGVPLAPARVDRHAQPLRAPWAAPGGPAASVRWAVDALAVGRGVTAVQQRTWNLSAVWRLDGAGGRGGRGRPLAWLKQVPPFLDHEAAVLRLLAAAAPGLAPSLLAAGPEGRHLLAHVPGDDQYGAGVDLRAAVAADWHEVQARLVDAADEVTAAGVPDRRRPCGRLVDVAQPYRDSVAGLGDLVDTLPERLAAVAACAVPDTLVHGDLHPGNVRADGARRVILDWGEASVGHPAYDIVRLTEGLPPADAHRLVAAWDRRWRATVAGCDPTRAVELLRPVVALSAAAQYAGFLRQIEPAEHPYHALDVPDRLTAAVTAARIGTATGIRLTP